MSREIGRENIKLPKFPQRPLSFNKLIDLISELSQVRIYMWTYEVLLDLSVERQKDIINNEIAFVRKTD